jgi:hypothetical protein
MNLVNKREQSYTAYIGRGGPLGNPFSHLPIDRTRAQVQVATVEDAVACCERWARGDPTWDAAIHPSQRERFLAAVDRLKEDDTLGCYCQAGAPCHGLVIMRLWAERCAASARPLPHHGNKRSARAKALRG